MKDEDTFHIVPLQRYDAILGVKWLSKFGPIKMDFLAQWMEIQKEGMTYRLEGYSHVDNFALILAT